MSAEFSVELKCAYLVCCTLDVNTTTAAGECAFDTNQHIAVQRFGDIVLVIGVSL